ncbi:MAG TPA: MFS transporter [Planctomycetia bacterium]|nr:MFS transporter [Planctomycetia bacterium]
MQSTIDTRGGTNTIGFWAVCVTQFLTAFVDNAFRIGVIVLAFYAAERAKHGGGPGPGVSGATVGALSTALMLLPYAIFSLAAGAMSDRFSKRYVFIFGKLAELPLVFLGMWGLWGTYRAAAAGESIAVPIAFVLVMIFFLGVQVSFLSPTRYGILPEILNDESLTPGNGYLEMCTYAGIFSGTVAAGYIAKGLDPAAPEAWAPYLVPLASILGVFTAFLVPKVPPSNPTASIAEGLNLRNYFKQFRHNIEVMKSRRGLIHAIFGLTLFWGLGTLVLLNAPAAASACLGLADNPVDNNAPAIAVSIGLGLGCVVAGWLSRGTIELGLAPVGAIGWTIALLLLPTVGWLGLVENANGVLVERFWPTAFLLSCSGFFAGVFIIPINAYLEHESPPEERASCIATANIVSVLGMLVACVINFTMPALLSPRAAVKAVWLIGAATMAVSSYYIFRTLPDFLARFAIVFLARCVYRIRATGLENLPKSGGALLVCNHVSFMDGVIVLTAVPRKVRFLVYRTHYENKYLNKLGELMGAIPIDGDGSPRGILSALRTASQALEEGDLVCIFAEGGISRTGAVLPFQRGMETILKRAKGVPVVPMNIDGMWGSIFSFKRGKFFGKFPERWPLVVTVAFGKPLPASAGAFDVQQQVQLLSVESWMRRKESERTLIAKFLRIAKRFPKRPALADLTRSLSYGEALMAATALSGVLARKLGPEKYVGVLVPPSVGGALVNLALALRGKVAVNLNYSIGAEVMDRCVAQCEIKQVLASRALLEKLNLAPKAEVIHLESLKEQVTKGDKIRAAAARYLPAWLSERTALAASRVGMDDLATIVFSSGSTGDPKGVMLTQFNIVSNAASVVQYVDADERDVIMGVLPFFHSFGYTVTLWLPLTVGAAAVYHFNPLEPDVVGELMQKHKATIFMSTATFLRGHLRKNKPEQWKSLRLMVCGAEKLPMQLADLVEEKLEFRPLEGYGCTELSPAVALNRTDVVEGSYRQVWSKRGTIGRPIPGVAVKITDPETYADLPLGQEGALLVKGPNVMTGYLNRPDLTDAAIRDGWYVTGDIAKLDEDGFITITDRLSRFSKIGGEMVPHAKVEDAIHEALETADRCCVVVGIPDERKGERLVVLHTRIQMSTDALWDRLRAKQIPPLWLPGKTSFHEVPEIPILGTGKTDLKGAKKLAIEKEA